MEPVGVFRRAIAVIIDGILLMIVGYALAQVMGGATATGFALQGGPAFIFFGIALAYYIVMEAITGQTLGKMAMKLKVVKKDGAKLDWQGAIVRNLLRIIDGFFFYLVGAIVVWGSKTKQRLGDMAANTIVGGSKAA